MYTISYWNNACNLFIAFIAIFWAYCLYDLRRPKTSLVIMLVRGLERGHTWSGKPTRRRDRLNSYIPCYGQSHQTLESDKGTDEEAVPLFISW